MIWNFSGFTKVLKMYIGLYKIKIDIIDFYSGTKCINNRYLNNIQKICTDPALTPIDSLRLL